MKAEGEKTGVRWTHGRLLRRSDSDDGKAGERNEPARNPSFSAIVGIILRFST